MVFVIWCSLQSFDNCMRHSSESINHCLIIESIWRQRLSCLIDIHYFFRNVWAIFFEKLLSHQKYWTYVNNVIFKKIWLVMRIYLEKYFKSFQSPTISEVNSQQNHSPFSCYFFFFLDYPLQLQEKMDVSSSNL